MDRRPPRTPAPLRRLIGLPVWAVAVLVALAVPGVLLQELGLHGVPWLSALLAVLPFSIWIVTALAADVESPVLTLLVVGGTFGSTLGLTYTALGLPADAAGLVLDDQYGELGLRLAVLISSVFTGFMVGLVAGLLAVGARLVLRRSGLGGGPEPPASADPVQPRPSEE